jgi:hypothetical protein
MNEELEAIANSHGIETLETRMSDELDFSDMAIWELKEMMEEAYKLGQSA